MYSQAHGDGCLIKKAVFSEKLWYYIKVYAGGGLQENVCRRQCTGYLKLDKNRLILFCKEDNTCVRK